ncbi:MAG TPA: hypothetical protein VIX18_03970 [Nitrospirota bacterium]
MFSELFSSLTTSCPAYVRNMDYLAEEISMRGRAQRNQLAWQPHLDRSRAFVLSAAERCSNRGLVVVLGAGLLLDVPLAELSSLFREVVLVDIVFLPEIWRWIRSFSNVKLLQYDVTGLAAKLYDNVQHGIPELPHTLPKMPETAKNAGLVVSLNILSQLWVIPRAYALKKIPNVDAERMDDWCGQMARSHYDLLSALACDVCLVADHEFVKRDRDGDVISRGSTIGEFDLPEPTASWTWKIAPAEERQPFSKELLVGAWHLR